MKKNLYFIVMILFISCSEETKNKINNLSDRINNNLTEAFTEVTKKINEKENSSNSKVEEKTIIKEDSNEE